MLSLASVSLTAGGVCIQVEAVSETVDDGEYESDSPHTTTSSLSSIDSTCSSRGSTVQVGNALSSLLSQAGPAPGGQFSSFGNPLAETAAVEAGETTAVAPTSTSIWPSGSSIMDTVGDIPAPRLGGAALRPGGVAGGMGWEPHGAVEDSGIVHQESDGAWRVQWRPLSGPAAAHVPKPVAPTRPHAPLPGQQPPQPQLKPLPRVERPVQCAPTSNR